MLGGGAADRTGHARLSHSGLLTLRTAAVPTCRPHPRSGLVPSLPLQRWETVYMDGPGWLHGTHSAMPTPHGWFTASHTPGLSRNQRVRAACPAQGGNCSCRTGNLTSCAFQPGGPSVKPFPGMAPALSSDLRCVPGAVPRPGGRGRGSRPAARGGVAVRHCPHCPAGGAPAGNSLSSLPQGHTDA